MFWVFTNNINHTFTSHNFTIFANFFNRSSNFHIILQNKKPLSGNHYLNLFSSIYYSTFSFVVRTHFHCNPVSCQNLNPVNSKLPSQMGNYLFSIVQFYPKKSTGQGFCNHSCPPKIFFIFFIHLAQLLRIAKFIKLVKVKPYLYFV